MGKGKKFVCVSFVLSILFCEFSTAQLISDYCNEKKSSYSLDNRVYYRVEKDFFEDNAWEIRGNNGVVGKIKRESSILGDEWKVVNKLGSELGYIDDKDFIKNLMKDNSARISIEKDFLGGLVIREGATRIGKINKPYNDTYSYPYNWSVWWNDNECDSNRFYPHIPNPLEEIRREMQKIISVPNPLEELKKELDPFKNLPNPFQYPMNNYQKPRQNKQLYNNLLPNPMEEMERSITSPLFGTSPRRSNTYHYYYSDPTENFLKTSPMKSFGTPSLKSFSTFDSDDMFGDSLFGSP